MKNENDLKLPMTEIMKSFQRKKSTSKSINFPGLHLNDSGSSFPSQNWSVLGVYLLKQVALDKKLS